MGSVRPAFLPWLRGHTRVTLCAAHRNFQLRPSCWGAPGPGLRYSWCLRGGPSIPQGTGLPWARGLGAGCEVMWGLHHRAGRRGGRPGTCVPFTPSSRRARLSLLQQAGVCPGCCRRDHPVQVLVWWGRWSPYPDSALPRSPRRRQPEGSRMCGGCSCGACNTWSATCT